MSKGRGCDGGYHDIIAECKLRSATIKQIISWYPTLRCSFTHWPAERLEPRFSEGDINEHAKGPNATTIKAVEAWIKRDRITQIEGNLSLIKSPTSDGQRHSGSVNYFC
jgi:hypothetical protein